MFGDHSIPSLILALKLFLNIGKLKFSLENRKNYHRLFFLSQRKRPENTSTSPAQAFGKTKEPLHNCINRARCHFKGAEEGRKRFQCRVVFSPLRRAPPCTVTVPARPPARAPHAPAPPRLAQITSLSPQHLARVLNCFGWRIPILKVFKYFNSHSWTF